MVIKWQDKPEVLNTFVEAGKIITEVFSVIHTHFFNPDYQTRVVVNCECVTKGKTNIIPYDSTQVIFHNLWVYRLTDKGWIVEYITKENLDIIGNVADFIEHASLTPKLSILITEEFTKKSKVFTQEIERIFAEEGLNNNNTILDWKRQRFLGYCERNYPWILQNSDGHNYLFNRWINNTKTVNIRKIRELYPDNIQQLDELDKTGFKSIIKDIIEPLDIFFLRFGNFIINNCKGIINQTSKDDVIDILRQDINKATQEINKTGTDYIKNKLKYQLNRLKKMDNIINPTEGLVLNFKEKMIKLTGSFAPINQILGFTRFA